MVKCCHRPGKSMKRRSTVRTSFSRMRASTSLGVTEATSREKGNRRRWLCGGKLVTCPSMASDKLAATKSPAARESCRSGTNRLGAALAGADADAIVERQHEDFAVPDLSGLTHARGVDDGFNRRLDKGVVDRDFQFELGQQADFELGGAVDL